MGELLNLIGLSSGVALYAMLLVMVVRAARAPGAPRVDRLLLATAFLGLAWNLCALPAYELPKLGIPGSFPFLMALGFSALGFLPAVAVHSVLRGEREGANRSLRRAVALTAYAVASVAAALQLRTLWIGAPLPSAPAMRLLTYSFVVLVVPLAVVTRGQPGARRALWAAALSIFAVSALHLSQLEQNDSPWLVELLGHHASLPLAIAILYQDFPFALADLFLKRALALLALVTTAFLAVVGVSVGRAQAIAPVQSARDVGILVTLWVATALLYPKLRDVTAWFVDAIVLDRPDYDALQRSIGQHAERREDIAALLDEACAELAPALSATVVQWRQADEGGSAPHQPAAPGTTLVEVPVAEPPGFFLEVSGLTGGRRLLSDDRVALDGIAAVLGRRIDAIRLARERYDRELRDQEMTQLATEAELRALRSQINPHFLFNALTTIGYLIQTAPERALETLMRLTSLLRAVLRSDGELTTLGREIELIEAYLDIERARFEQRLRVHVDVPLQLRGLRLPPLLLQPVVENAVKHGIAPLRLGGDVSVHARLEPGDDGRASVVLTVTDTGTGATAAALERGRAAGVGLRNVAQRLAGQYGRRSTLEIRCVPGVGTTVEIRIPADDALGAIAAAQSAS